MEIKYDYTILESRDVNELTKKVKEYLKNGWILLGGISVSGGLGYEYFYQALSK